ncbi:hypothetical protein, partial [Kaistella sp.]|uniref:hypothetical protein n=1 Tax=Kaistella sp. TaxID=2782235 RepID=UPI002F94BF58
IPKNKTETDFGFAVSSGQGFPAVSFVGNQPGSNYQQQGNVIIDGYRVRRVRWSTIHIIVNTIRNSISITVIHRSSCFRLDILFLSRLRSTGGRRCLFHSFRLGE